MSVAGRGFSVGRRCFGRLTSVNEQGPEAVCFGALSCGHTGGMGAVTAGSGSIHLVVRVTVVVGGLR